MVAPQTNDHPTASNLVAQPTTASLQAAAGATNYTLATEGIEGTNGGSPKKQWRDSSIYRKRSDGRFSTNHENSGSGENPTASSSEPAIRRRSKNSEISQQQRRDESSFSASTFSNSAREPTSTGTSTGINPEMTQDPGTTDNTRNPGNIPNPRICERTRNSSTGTLRSRLKGND
jgi:hypothetical protein